MFSNIFTAVNPPNCPGTIILMMWETKRRKVKRWF